MALRGHRANEGAALANERAGKLEHDNLELRGKIAGLETQAADAESARQRVEIELEKQKERTANAERELFELREKIADRHIPSERWLLVVNALKKGPLGHVKVVADMKTTEPGRFGAEIVAALTEAGWQVAFVTNAMIVHFGAPNKETMAITVKDQHRIPVRAAILQRALELGGFPAPLQIDADLADNDVVLQILSR